LKDTGCATRKGDDSHILIGEKTNHFRSEMRTTIVHQERGRDVRSPHGHSKALDLSNENVPDISVTQNFVDI
jgi:hypothetical protein